MQAFQPTFDRLTKIRFKLKGMGTIRFEIVHMDGQAMFGAPIDHHYIIDLTNREEYFYVEFDDPLAVIPGDTYHVYLQLASVDQAHWPYTSNASCYSKEAGYLFGWEVIGDFDFATYGYSSTAGQTQVLPSSPTTTDQGSAVSDPAQTTPSSTTTTKNSVPKKSVSSTTSPENQVNAAEEVSNNETTTKTPEGSTSVVEDSLTKVPEDKSFMGRVSSLMKGSWDGLKNNWRTILEVFGLLMIVALAAFSFFLYRKQKSQPTVSVSKEGSK